MLTHVKKNGVGQGGKLASNPPKFATGAEILRKKWYGEKKNAGRGAEGTAQGDKHETTATKKIPTTIEGGKKSIKKHKKGGREPYTGEKERLQKDIEPVGGSGLVK